MPRMTLIAVALAALAATAAGTPVGSLVPDEVPDRGPALSERVERGSLVLTDVAPVAPSTKTVDGSPEDWTGTSARIAGQSHLDRGELVHTDFLFDAYGADDGGDIDRWNRFAGLLYQEERTERLDDLARTSGSQLGVPEPIGADDEYGDADRSLAEGDITDLRFAVQDDRLHVLVRTSNMTDPSRLAVTLMADRTDSLSLGRVAELGDADVGAVDQAVILSLRGSRVVGADGLAPLTDVEVAADAAGWTNTFEASVPLDLVARDGVLDLGVMTALEDADTDVPGPVTPLNIAFRASEPVDIYNDRLQAFALHGDAPDGSRIDQFTSGPVAVADLVAGRTQTWEVGPGYHEVQFTSGDNISQEVNKDGLTQPYGLAVPTTYTRDETLDPVNFWMHYRGGKAHSAAAINPRLIRAHGEEIGALVVSPRGRGTSTWYVTQAHQDFWEVYADAHERFPDIDPQRRYLSGYSMGGYGTWLMSTLYPDLFAAGFAVSGAVTQGAWTGLEGDACRDLDGEYSTCYIQANGGDADAQLTYRLLENLKHFPIAIDHGTDDELVPLPQIERMSARLTELGYEHRLTRFVGYEHFTQAAMEEWSDGTRYQASHVLPENPREVTYKIVPAFVEALNTIRKPEWQDGFDFDPDGAFWVDGIEPRDGDVTDTSNLAMVDVESQAIAADEKLTVPDAGSASPLYHSTPSVRTGLQHVELPVARPLANVLRGTLTNVAEVSFDVGRAGLEAQAFTLDLAVDGDGSARLVGFFDDANVPLPQVIASAGATVKRHGRDLTVTWTGVTSVTVTTP